MTASSHFETFRRADGDFGWRLVAGNGKKVATSGEGFTRLEDAVRAIDDMLDAARDAVIGTPGLVDAHLDIRHVEHDDEQETASG